MNFASILKVLFTFAQFSNAKYIARGPKSLPPMPICTTVVNFSPAAFVISPLCTLFARSAIFCCCCSAYQELQKVSHNRLTQLSTGHMVKHHTLFSGIDHLTIVESLKFLRKLCLFRQLGERTILLRWKRNSSATWILTMPLLY